MLELNATIREPKKKLGTLRKSGAVPAVLYGPGVEPQALQVPRGAFDRTFSEAGESSLVKLLVERDGKMQPFIVLIRDVQRDPVRMVPVHLDFHAVRLDEEIRIDVPIEFVGASSVEARSEGVLAKEMHELEVEALPEKLPHGIPVDVSSLDVVDAAIRVADLKLPDGVRVLNDPEAIIVRVAPLISEEEIAAVEAPAEEGPPEAEVVGKKEKEEETEEASEGKREETASAQGES